MVNIDDNDVGSYNVGHVALNSINNAKKKADEYRGHLGLTQDTRATVDNVLDPRTINIINKMINNGIFNKLMGNISTGKEANVYYGDNGNNGLVAVKVYKTSILIFKDRSKYVEGEYRFRKGYCKSNPRKMVNMWAEKEMRNLNRINNYIPSPKVIICRNNVLVMEYLGDGDNNNKAYPRLKDVIKDKRINIDIYIQVIMIMRIMFNKCKLVHGDLSEFNMLLSPNNIVYIIDVSQSVEHDHIHALDFLKRDIVNVTRFFRNNINNKDGSNMMTNIILDVNTLFDYIITNDDIPSSSSINNSVSTTTIIDHNNKELYDIINNNGNRLGLPIQEQKWLFKLLTDHHHVKTTMIMMSSDDEEEDDELLFLDTYIPSTLNQFSDLMEMEVELSKHAKGEKSVYNRLLATTSSTRYINNEDNNGQQEQQEQQQQQDDDDDTVVGGGGGGVVLIDDGHIPDGMSKGEWKRLVKEKRRAKLENKCPKHIKKRYRSKAANR